MDYKRIKEIISATADEAGIKEYEIYCTESDDMSADTLKQEINAFSSGTSGGVGFRCIVDGHMGYASSSSLDKDDLTMLVYKAVENAKAIENDDEVFIYAGSDSYAELEPVNIEKTDASVLKNCALSLQKKMYDSSEYIADGTQAGAVYSSYEVYLYNSHGLELTNRSGFTACYAAPAVNKDGEAQSDFEIAAGLEGEEVDKLPQSAIESALEKIGAVEVDSGKYDIIIDGKQMRSMLSAFSPAFSAKSALLGLSLLAGKEGTQVASECVTITDDPMREGCPFKTNFDGEGVATYKKDVIKDGKLVTLLYDLTNAKKAGKTTTANGQRSGYAGQVAISPYNFSISAGEDTLDEMFAKMGDGLYVTELKGLHAGADAITGDFSIESAGFRIKDGKKAEAVKSFTIAGNFFEMLKSIDALSNEVKWSPLGGACAFGSPDVYIKNMSVAGK